MCNKGSEKSSGKETFEIWYVKHLLVGGEVRGWRNRAQRKKDPWTWTTVRWLPGGRGVRGLNGNGKNIIKIIYK